MKTIKIFSAIIGMMLIAQFALAQKMLVDNSYQDESFLKFKVKLLDAILEKDTAKLFALVDDGTAVNPRPGKGMDDFKQSFRGELYNYNSENDPYEELLKVISFGFRKNVIGNATNFWDAELGETVFQAPSYFPFIAGNQDIYLFVLADKVNVREKPTIYSKVVGQVSQELLLYTLPDRGVIAIFNDGYHWLQVKLSNGKTGYIADVFTSVSVLKELSVRKVNGEWRIVSYFSPPGC